MLTLQIKEKEIENLTPDEEFIRGTVGAKCQINFDDFWQYYEKYVVFKRVGYEPINIIVDSLENEIEIPYTILSESGEFKIGVFGITETETLPTLYSKDIKILYGTDTHGTTPPTYIPSEIDQLRLSKQDKLVSGENIKTVNGESVLGSGNIKIQIEVDQTYDPDSTNAQSGTAVAKALSGYVVAEVGKGLSSNDFTNEDKEKLYSALQNENIDQTYSPTSENAQSGKAVAEAVAIEQKRADSTFANALKGSKSGSAILIDDVSPVTHEMGVMVRGKNLIPYPYRDTTKTENGITFTDNGDGSITVSGTATAQTYFYLFRYKKIKAGTCTLSGCPSGGGSSTYKILGIITASDGTKSYLSDYGNSATTTFKEDVTMDLRIQIENEQTIENLIFKPQLEYGTTATPYTPYVPDLTAVKVSRCGKNLFSLANRTWANFGDKDPTTVRNISKDNFYFKITANNYANNSATDYEIIDGNSIKITTTNAYGLGVPFHLIAGQQYTISCIKSDDIKCRINIGYYDIEGNYLSGKFEASTFTMPENAYWAMLCFVGFISSGTAEELTFTNIQLELGTTATDYEPYKECAEYTPTADGTVNGVTSLYPNTTLTTDTDGVLIDCEYNRDINKAFAALEAAIATNNS